MEKDGERVLVVADLHLGWEVSLSHQGIHVPSQVPRLLEKLRKIINDTHPRRLILLGDVKHAVAKRSEEHTSELQSRSDLVCRLLLEKKKKILIITSLLLLTTYHLS